MHLIFFQACTICKKKFQSFNDNLDSILAMLDKNCQLPNCPQAVAL